MITIILKYVIAITSVLAILIVSYLPSNNNLQLTIKPQQLFKIKKSKGLISQLNKLLTILLIITFASLLFLNK